MTMPLTARALVPHLAALIAVLAVPTAGALAQTAREPASEAGPRFAFQPVEGGVLRLDLHLGTVSQCAPKEGRYACTLVEDDRKALVDEIDRLRKALAEAKALPGAEGQAPSLGWPKEGEIDRALDLIEQMARKLQDRFQRLDVKPAPQSRT